MQYHIDNPAFSLRHQESRRAIERNLAYLNQRLTDLQEIAGNLSQHEAKWRLLEAEGLLYGHESLKKEAQRTNLHVDVEGLANVTTRTESFQYSVCTGHSLMYPRHNKGSTLRRG